MLLRDETIALVPFEPAHSQLYLQWVNTEELARLLGRCLPVTAAEHEGWYRAQVGSNSTVIFAVETLDERKYLGNVWLHNIHWVNRSAELRILLGAPEAQGRGYGSRACRLLLRFAFEKLGLHKVYLYVGSFNPRGVRAFEKAGFSEEALLKDEFFVDGRFMDVKRMAAFSSQAATRS